MDSKKQNELYSVYINRGSIITSFAVIETLLSEFVIKHYIKDPNLLRKIREDFFENQYFSWQLKINLFENVLTKDFSEKIDGKTRESLIGKLKNLAKHRNIVAHAALDIPVDEKGIQGPPHFSHNGLRMNAEDEMDKYNNLRSEIEPEIEKLAKEVGLFNISVFDNGTLREKSTEDYSKTTFFKID